MFIFGSLQRNAIDRTSGGAQVATYTTFPHIRIACQNDPASPARGQLIFYLRIQDRFTLMKHVQKHNTPQDTEHISSFFYYYV